MLHVLPGRLPQQFVENGNGGGHAAHAGVGTEGSEAHGPEELAPSGRVNRRQGGKQKDRFRIGQRAEQRQRAKHQQPHGPHACPRAVGIRRQQIHQHPAAQKRLVGDQISADFRLQSRCQIQPPAQQGIQREKHNVESGIAGVDVPVANQAHVVVRVPTGPEDAGAGKIGGGGIVEPCASQSSQPQQQPGNHKGRQHPEKRLPDGQPLPGLGPGQNAGGGKIAIQIPHPGQREGRRGRHRGNCRKEFLKKAQIRIPRCSLSTIACPETQKKRRAGGAAPRREGTGINRAAGFFGKPARLGKRVNRKR